MYVCARVCVFGGGGYDQRSSVLAICWQSHRGKATAAKQWRAMTGQDLCGGCVRVCFPFKDPNEPLSMSMCGGAWLLMIGCLCYQAID